MPRAQNLLDDDLIIEDLQATDKSGVIREFAAFLKSRGKMWDEDELFDIVMQRESTAAGTGDGTVIPQGRLNDLAGVLVASGHSRKGVAARSTDNKPSRLFALFIAPESRSGDQVPVLREQLLWSTGRREMQKLILEVDDKYPNCR
jgi:mannitol/fructose-specific phosphotransferase system IIA component (Ntr-type)